MRSRGRRLRRNHLRCHDTALIPGIGEKPQGLAPSRYSTIVFLALRLASGEALARWVCAWTLAPQPEVFAPQHIGKNRYNRYPKPVSTGMTETHGEFSYIDWLRRRTPSYP